MARQSLDADGTVTTVRSGGGTERTIASFAEPPGLEPRVTLHAAGERALRTALLLPSWHRPGTPLPVLMDPYGGPHAQRVVAARGAHLTSQWFAEQGFAVVVVDLPVVDLDVLDADSSSSSSVFGVDPALVDEVGTGVVVVVVVGAVVVGRAFAAGELVGVLVLVGGVVLVGAAGMVGGAGRATPGSAIGCAVILTPRTAGPPPARGGADAAPAVPRASATPPAARPPRARRWSAASRTPAAASSAARCAWPGPSPAAPRRPTP